MKPDDCDHSSISQVNTQAYPRMTSCFSSQTPDWAGLALVTATKAAHLHARGTMYTRHSCCILPQCTHACRTRTSRCCKSPWPGDNRWHKGGADSCIGPLTHRLHGCCSLDCEMPQCQLRWRDQAGQHVQPTTCTLHQPSADLQQLHACCLSNGQVLQHCFRLLNQAVKHSF